MMAMLITFARTLVMFVAWTLVGILALLILFSTLALMREKAHRKDAAPAGGNWVTANDVELHYRTEGDPSDPPVVLLHGMAAWSGTWQPTMEALAQAGYYAIAFDMPPFGFSVRQSASSPRSTLWA